ncbi:epithelial cell adhesion molecule isoform X2 [Oncorhynchus mykiss]|uniref:epithelial cell adhesion molecule isoform X2 n=1 Tax=Oncorhynchus mykiss TaxID=8022 RepID=UPI000B4F4EC9|nr:epithelial cell adhesion molecule isoform X2 [Oncorhynchus mykiss]
MMIYILITDKECNDDAFPVREDCEVDTVCGEAICHHNQYVTCHVNRCGTCEPVFRGYDNITVNCTQLTPKCRLIHLEMLSKHRTGTMLTGGSLGTKYHPNCDGAGMFRPKQCREEDTKLCWCVNNAGVPVSDKTHDPLKCDRLVTVHVIDIQFTFKVEFTPVAKTMDEIRRQLVLKLDREYTLDKTQILDITVRELYQVVSIRLTDDRTDKEPVDIATVAYYIERDLKSNRFGFEVDGRRLEVARDSVKVLFFHYDHQHMDMMTINPGFAALILIIALAIIIGVSVSVSKSKTNCTLDLVQYHCHPHNFSLSLSITIVRWWYKGKLCWRGDSSLKSLRFKGRTTTWNSKKLP